MTSLRSVTSVLTMPYVTSYTTSVYQTREKSLFFIFPTGRIRVSEIRFASTVVVCGNPSPVCKEKNFYHRVRARIFFLSSMQELLLRSLRKKMRQFPWYCFQNSAPPKEKPFAHRGSKFFPSSVALVLEAIHSSLKEQPLW